MCDEVFNGICQEEYFSLMRFSKLYFHDFLKWQFFIKGVKWRLYLCYKLVTRFIGLLNTEDHCAILQVIKWNGGSTSYPFHLIFTMAPNTFRCSHKSISHYSFLCSLRALFYCWDKHNNSRLATLLERVNWNLLPLLQSLVPRACKQGNKSKAGAIKCCKESKITAPPNEWHNIPMFFQLIKKNLR